MKSSSAPFHLVSINCRYSHSCLAQFYVRQELKKHLPHRDVALSQLTINDPYYQTLLRLRQTPARAIFFSVYIWNHEYVRRLINDLSRVLPDTPLVLGGPQASSLTDLPRQCTVVTGEIEAVGGQFYQDLESGLLQPLYRAGKSSLFPSPYVNSDFQQELKNRQLYYEGSRGCPFSCAYCLSSIAKGVRHKPLELIKKELSGLIAAKPMIIKFVDRTFNDDPPRALAIWKFLADNAGEVTCHFEIAPDRFTEEMLDFLPTVRCDQFQFEIGIQSCNRETLQAVNRQMDIERAGENIRRLMALDTIHLHVDLILGLPFETRESFADSFNQVFSLAPHYIQLGLLKVLPGTAMEKKALEFGLVYCAEPPYEILATNWMNSTTMCSLYQFCEVVESFYNNRFFRTLWDYLRLVEEDSFLFFSVLLDICLKQGFFELARTHKLMHRLLFETVGSSPDGELLQELLCYDWLRCGHRSLPGYCNAPAQKEIRDSLRLKLPQSLPGLFDYRSRVEFLKQASFFEMSGRALEKAGLGSQGGLVVFLPEQSQGVMRYCTTKVLDV
ncbi:MAG: DUF4080 domain-containing protein [Desulfobulbus sp.]|nr:MAG: DUF4080 domain-containing protein [Desulfobulbus sp.]